MSSPSNIIYNKYSADTETLLSAIEQSNLSLIESIISRSNKWSMDWNAGLKEASHIGSVQIIKIMIKQGANNLPLAYSIAARNRHTNAEKYIESIMKADNPTLFNHAEYFTSH